MYRQIFVSNRCMGVIQREVSIAKGTETGGSLVGYQTVDSALVITDACGPGPKAILKRTSVQIDGAFSDIFCKASRVASNGAYDYVGDWHRHTGWSLDPSEADNAAMKKMSDWASCPSRPLVSLIYRKWPKGCRVYAFTARMLTPVPHFFLGRGGL